jgi:hypothetical protein
MLQLAVLLLGCALSRYLWTISRTIGGMILAITLLGVSIYIFLTLVATIYSNCPYQTPPSIIARTIIRYLSHSNTAFARSLRSLIASLPSIPNLRKFLGHLHSGVRQVAKAFGCAPVVTTERKTYHSLRDGSTRPDLRARCRQLGGVQGGCPLHLLGTRFHHRYRRHIPHRPTRCGHNLVPGNCGDIVTHTLADLFFDCFLDGEIIPGKTEHAISIGMALASVLSVQLSMEPESETLEALCQRLRDHVRPEFLRPRTGINILAGHGSPQICRNSLI